MRSKTKENLIGELVKNGYLKTPVIIEAFQKIDRKDFIREETMAEAYGNYPLPIGRGQTISQPLTVAFMLELLEPKAGEKILDVGAGSGWQTALLAQIVGESGKIIAIERIPELKIFAEENIAKYEHLKNTQIILSDGSQGHELEMPYDKIVAAATANEIPLTWKEQLKIGGRIVAPVGQSIFVLDKTGQNQFSQKQFFGFSFVPLIKE
ncbi:MAG: protein-L-isoaspartate(D-aspartate) O-methyltransferase [Patescibacteria group bacterium]